MALTMHTYLVHFWKAKAAVSIITAMKQPIACVRCLSFRLNSVGLSSKRTLKSDAGWSSAAKTPQFPPSERKG